MSPAASGWLCDTGAPDDVVNDWPVILKRYFRVAFAVCALGTNTFPAAGTSAAATLAPAPPAASVRPARATFLGLAFDSVSSRFLRLRCAPEDCARPLPTRYCVRAAPHLRLLMEERSCVIFQLDGAFRLDLNPTHSRIGRCKDPPEAAESAGQVGPSILRRL
jgi:hypothetical protein